MAVADDHCHRAQLLTVRTFRPGRYTLPLQLRAGTQRATATIRVTVRKP